MEAPRPSEGLVQAHASPTAARPVATGSPSTRCLRCRSSIAAITCTPVMGWASPQCATLGNSLSAASQAGTARSARSSLSRAEATKATPQVPESHGSVRIDTPSKCCSIRSLAGGQEPSADRKCRA